MDTLHRIRWANVALAAALVVLLVTIARTVAAGAPPAVPPDEPVPVATATPEPVEAVRSGQHRRARRPKPGAPRPRRSSARSKCPRCHKRPRRAPARQAATPPSAPQPAPPYYAPPPPAIEFGFERP